MYFLPLYFQGVLGFDATRSGIQMLPILITVGLGTILWGAIVSFIGYYTPFLIVGSILFTVGVGLISTVSVDTNIGNCIGYELLAGIGFGMCAQVPSPYDS